ncbi:MAG: DUF1778 domain-containing protein [Microthrixaceae bacterium]
MATRVTKSRQVNLRVSESDRASLERAAAIAGISLSTLMLQASLDRAEHLLREHAALVLPSELFDDLLAALDEPVRALPDRLVRGLEQLPDTVESL